LIEYLNELRESCLDAHTGIVQGLNGSGATPNPEVIQLWGFVEKILEFVTTVAIDPEKSDSVVASSAGLIGDLCSVFNAQILPLVETEAIVSLLQAGRRSKANKTKTLATWATKEIRRIKNSINNGFTGAMPGAIPT